MGGIGFMEIGVLVFVILAISILPTVFYLITLQSTLNEVSRENRRMEPGMVWLVLIPLFGIVWQFIIVNNIADSLQAEFKVRNIDVGEERPGIGIGLAYCILMCCSIIPFLGFFTSVAALVCWIIYWVKISGFKDRLRYLKYKY